MTGGIRIKWFIAMFGVLLGLSQSVRAVEVNGIKLDNTASVADQELVLNGAGVRTKVFFKVYVAGLYLSSKKASVPEVLAAPGPKRVTLVMLREVSAEQFGQGFLDGISNNSTKAEKSKFVAQMLKFGEMFSKIPELKKGDLITVDWIPGTGTSIQLNGKKLSENFPDEDFYNALLKIWLGDKPVDNILKRQLLAEKSE
ncbi:MAG: chalcone isomerase family protein [Pseudomonadota bacterium]